MAIIKTRDANGDAPVKRIVAMQAPDQRRATKGRRNDEDLRNKLYEGYINLLQQAYVHAQKLRATNPDARLLLTGVLQSTGVFAGPQANDVIRASAEMLVEACHAMSKKERFAEMIDIEPVDGSPRVTEMFNDALAKQNADQAADRPAADLTQVRFITDAHQLTAVAGTKNRVQSLREQAIRAVENYLTYASKFWHVSYYFGKANEKRAITTISTALKERDAGAIEHLLGTIRPKASNKACAVIRSINVFMDEIEGTQHPQDANTQVGAGAPAAS